MENITRWNVVLFSRKFVITFPREKFSKILTIFQAKDAPLRKISNDFRRVLI